MANSVLIPWPNFFINYSKSIEKIKPNLCWKSNNTIEQKNCVLNQFINGQNVTLTYISEHYPKTNEQIPMIPPYNCKQVVLGPFELIVPYFYYNIDIEDNFILLAAKDWSETLNEKFVNCIFNLLFNGMTSCKFPIRLLLPKDVTKLLKVDGTPRVTLYELCIILLQSERFDVFEYPTDNNEYRMLFLKPKSVKPNKSIKGGKRRYTKKNKP
jgi:hypothetical protein